MNGKRHDDEAWADIVTRLSADPRFQAADIPAAEGRDAVASGPTGEPAAPEGGWEPGREGGREAALEDGKEAGAAESSGPSGPETAGADATAPLPEGHRPPSRGFSAFDPLGINKAGFYADADEPEQYEPAGAAPAAPHQAGGPRDYSVDEEVLEELDRFVPEEPEPLSWADPAKVLAWAGAAGAPLLALLVLMFFRNAPQQLWWLIGLGFITGLGYLIWKMPHERNEYDGDDGARL